MLATVRTCAVIGLDGALVEVEVDSAPGTPGLTIVGLPDAALKVLRGCFGSPAARPAAPAETVGAGGTGG